MTDKQHLIDLLAGRHLFLSSLHYTRFVQLYDTIEELPFFCGGLIKCALCRGMDSEFPRFFSGRFDDRFGERLPGYFPAPGTAQGASPFLSPGEKTVFEMALAFLEHPGQTPSDSFLLQLSHIWVPIADNALAASEIIDHPDRAEEPEE